MKLIQELAQPCPHRWLVGGGGEEWDRRAVPQGPGRVGQRRAAGAAEATDLGLSSPDFQLAVLGDQLSVFGVRA